LLVVGIGASAGGIAALRQFFAHVPAKSGAAYAVILHLSPDYESRLAEVLQTATSLPITQVQGTIPVQADHIYVIAPNASLKMIDGAIVTEAISGRRNGRAPVDLFFRTLADWYGRNAVAVVLSGTGPNGSSGLKRVKEHGGLTIARIRMRRNTGTCRGIRLPRVWWTTCFPWPTFPKGCSSTTTA
jgi:two-component system CheB/CheR fusion protein